MLNFFVLVLPLFHRPYFRRGMYNLFVQVPVLFHYPIQTLLLNKLVFQRFRRFIFLSFIIFRTPLNLYYRKQKLFVSQSPFLFQRMKAFRVERVDYTFLWWLSGFVEGLGVEDTIVMGCPAGGIIMKGSPTVFE